MQKSTNQTTSNKDKKSEVQDFGLSFKGQVISISEAKEWTDYNTKAVLGQQQTVGVTDRVKQYTWTVKAPMGESLPPLEFFQEVVIKDASVSSDKGMHRISGTYKPA